MNRKGEIFKDSAHQERFNRFGYLIIPAFTADEISEILAFYSLRQPELSKDFYSSIESSDANYRLEVDRFLKSYFNPLIETIFVRYISLAATFIVKRGANSTIYDHTDDCLIDESQFTSVNIWCPLVDTNIENGALRVLPGSHRIPNAERGFGIPFRFWSYRDEYSSRMEVCPMRAGEALLYDPRLIHNSYPNLSGADRPAMITGAIPAEATPHAIFRYPGLPDDEYEEFEVNTHFWHHFDKFARPEGYKSLGIKKYTPTAITKEELLSYLL